MSQARDWWARWWRLGLLAVVGLALLGLPLLLSLKPIAWQLNLVARTEVARVQLVDAQSWQLSNATVCVTADHPAVSNVVKPADSVCSGRLWRPLQTDGDPLQRVLHLAASMDAPIDVQVEVFRSGELRMALRLPDSAGNLGTLSSHDSNGWSGRLGAQVNLIWPALTAEQAANQDDGGVSVLPFSGAIVVGRDVSWSTQRMLMGGEITVFSASENHLAGRTVAEQSVLMLGDRVDIVAVDKPAGTPKGFLRVNRLAGSQEQTNTMDVVVYAPAEQAIIHRYGGGDYRFQASWWVRLRHQSSLVIVLLVLTGVLSIVSSLIEIVPGCRKVLTWCRKAPGQPDGSSDGLPGCGDKSL